MDDKEGTKARLRNAGLRATRSRVLVLRCLLEAARPLSHGEVCERLGEHGIDRATLYRNLVDLNAAGIATRTDLGDHLWRFGIAEGKAHDGKEHPHFVCEECGDVRCLPENAVSVSAPRGAPRSLRGDVAIQLRGLCNACA